MTQSLRRHGRADGEKNHVGQDLALLAIVTVAYNPDLGVLSRQLDQLPVAALKVIVDNASSPELRPGIAHLAKVHSALLLQNETNSGLPAALNQGVRSARQMRPSLCFLLLLDQDTEPGEGGVENLIASYETISTLAAKRCCIGPRLVDAQTRLDYGFHQIRGWRWVRNFPPDGSHQPIPLANLNGSGTLMPQSLFDELGGLEEDFFIDHVDTEWAFRVLAAGYGLYGVPDVVFQHRMGERSLRIWFFGWRIWPERTPQRHYYLFRNAVRLMHRPYVPIVWKAWAIAKLLLTFLKTFVFGPQRTAQISSMWRGMCEGMAEKRKNG